MQERLVRLKDWMLRHERVLSAVGLLAGFVFDSLTSNSPDQWFANISLLSYFIITAGCIVLSAIRGPHGMLGPLPLLTIMQFGFGNLTSALLVLYVKSGTFVGSGVFLFALLSFLVGNEFLRGRYVRTHVQLATWFLLFLPYVVMITPVLIGRFGDFVFLASGIIALGVVLCFIAVLFRVAPAHMRAVVPRAVVLIGLVYGTFTGFYFMNLIPPVPLSLTAIGTYHNIERTVSGDYEMTYEPPAWWQQWRDTAAEFTVRAGDPAYCFSAVFAPTRFSTPVYHRWEAYDESAKEWRTLTYLSFPISGGRDGGYRGYTLTHKLPFGKARCSVETERGALIGRVTFTVRDASLHFAPPLLKVTR